MPFDNVYREKKMPSPLLYTWRLFSSDGLAMVGFYGVLGLLLLCLLGSTLAPYTSINSFRLSAIATFLVTLWQCFLLPRDR